MTISFVNTLPQHMRPMLVRSVSEPLAKADPVAIPQVAADTTLVEICEFDQVAIRAALPVAVLAQIRLRPQSFSMPTTEPQSVHDEEATGAEADADEPAEVGVEKQTCLICYNEYVPGSDSMRQYSNCNHPQHTYCPTCIENTVRSYLAPDNIMRVERCIGYTCGGALSEEQLQHILGDDYHKVRRFRLGRTATVWCSDPSCASPLEGTRRKGHCVDCPRLTCMNCNRRYHRGPCLPKIPNVGAGFHAAIHGAQQCKKCNRWIIKNGGCDHMTCRSCGYEFCWLCKQDWRGHKDKWCVVKIVPNTFHRFTGPSYVKPITVPLATAAAGVAIGVAGAAAGIAAAGATVAGTGAVLFHGARGVGRGVRRAYRRVRPKRPQAPIDMSASGGIGELSAERLRALHGGNTSIFLDEITKEFGEDLVL